MSAIGRWLRQWTGVRDLSDDAAAAVADAFADPAADDVAWLTSAAPDHDEDHARWELRYAKRSFVLIAAKLDSLNDETPQAVGHAIERALAVDADVDAARKDVAVRQFNARLRAYHQAIQERDERPLAVRLGRLLLSYMGVFAPAPGGVEAAGAILMRQLEEANVSLRKHFGSACLPEDVAPSMAPGNARR